MAQNGGCSSSTQRLTLEGWVSASVCESQNFLFFFF